MKKCLDARFKGELGRCAVHLPLRPDFPATSFPTTYEVPRVFGKANVVVYSYQYLLDPKVAGIISVVVFDEAHNIDNVCIEALSVSVRKQTLEGATRNLNKMSQEIDRNFYSAHESMKRENKEMNSVLTKVIDNADILDHCYILQ
ncbi:sugar phosphate transporter domain-containing protein [Artemisia annua]|uniref:Sugar phosphate transporter domain-containing protein n=1 Tax=Artemisia annua TaxID=35608 RepID=A0A2U1QPA0_ARTAN|nr:sugar phosphate transporter domain-containing protein [Artemisia annua]